MWSLSNSLRCLGYGSLRCFTCVALASMALSFEWIFTRSEMLDECETQRNGYLTTQ